MEYVFSDKTGTLTCNVMEFKKFTAGVRAYGTDEKPTEKQLDNVSFNDPKMFETLAKKGGDDYDALYNVLLFLSICHTIIIDQKTSKYNAASPDELALVNAAKQFGFEFEGYDKDDKMIINAMGQRKLYEVLHIGEFTSARKRMSIIVRDERGNIRLLCKGADSIVFDRLSNASKSSMVYKETQRSVDEYARIGLRTLFLAEKVISEDVFNQWNVKAKEAALSIENRDEKIAAADEEIEVEMELVGSTAIEDRL